MRPQIIYLNGPSSAGKTSLARMLQASLDPPFLALGIDTLIGLMPAKLNSWDAEDLATQGFSFSTSHDAEGAQIRSIHAGPYGKKIGKLFYELAALMARLGHNLILDDVALTLAEVEDWKQCLKDFPVLYVGITASLPDLERRERERGDRTTGTARAQHQKLAFGQHYDLLLDTSRLTLEQCAGVIKARLAAR